MRVASGSLEEHSQDLAGCRCLQGEQLFLGSSAAFEEEVQLRPVDQEVACQVQMEEEALLWMAAHHGRPLVPSGHASGASENLQLIQKD